MFNKKGQAAMEFLMTYGWAILAAIIAIGVLSYFYFSPGDMAPNAALLSAPLYAQAWSASPTGVSMGIKNAGQEDITITSIKTDGDAIDCDSGSLTTSVAPGEVGDVKALCTLTANENYKADVIVKYTRAGSAVELTSTGSVSTKVVA